MALRQLLHRLLANSNRLCEDRVSPRMRHQKKTIKLGRTADHRRALLANQVCALIQHQRIKTTLAKAKAVLEARAEARYEAEKAEYEAKVQRRQEQARHRKRKPGGRPPQPPK